MKKNSAISAFIDEKYIPLDKKYKLAIFIVLLILPIVLFYFLIFKPGNTEIDRLRNEKASLEKEVAELEAKAANLPKFRQELKETEAQFNLASRLLPKEKEIPTLLTNISSLGRGAGLDFLSFKPSTTTDRDFYREIPVSISVNGPYHNVGVFFDQISKLSRIVSVTSVKMGNPTKSGGDMMLKSECNLMTYQFTNIQVSKPNKGKKGKRK